MNVLLTGGTGYIGSHTAVALVEAGHQVVLYDSLRNSSVSVVDRLEEIMVRRPRFVRGDVRDVALLTETLQENEIEAVIHFAGLKAVGESARLPVEYYDANVGGGVCLLRAMQGADVKTLVFSSSATIYGAPTYLPVDESHGTGPNNPYGRSKLYFEEMLADLVASDGRWGVACLRYFNPVGAHDSALIGERPNGLPSNLVPLLALVAAGELPCLDVLGSDYRTPDGTGVRDYVHVMDLADGHLAALERLTRVRGYDVINLGTGKGHSVLEMIDMFEKVSGKAISYRFSPRRPGDVDASYADAGKALRDLGWTATRTLADMCLSAWNFQRSLGA